MGEFIKTFFTKARQEEDRRINSHGFEAVFSQAERLPDHTREGVSKARNEESGLRESIMLFSQDSQNKFLPPFVITAGLGGAIKTLIFSFLIGLIGTIFFVGGTVAVIEGFAHFINVLINFLTPS